MCRVKVARRRLLRGRSWFADSVGPGRPLLARSWQQVERPELVQADDHGRIALTRDFFAVGDVVELEHPVLLGLEVWIVAQLPGLDHLKGDTLLTEEHAETLVADVVDHPLSHQVVGQLGERPGRKGLAVIARAPKGDLFDSGPLGQGELGWSATGVLGGQRIEAIGVEVVDHLADPVLGGEGDLGDGRHVHPLGRPQHDLGSTPSHHRTRTPPDDPQEPVAFFVGDVPDCHAFCHGTTLRDRSVKVVDARPQRCRSRH